MTYLLNDVFSTIERVTSWLPTVTQPCFPICWAWWVGEVSVKSDKTRHIVASHRCNLMFPWCQSCSSSLHLMLCWISVFVFIWKQWLLCRYCSGISDWGRHPRYAEN